LTDPLPKPLPNWHSAKAFGTPIGQLIIPSAICLRFNSSKTNHVSLFTHLINVWQSGCSLPRHDGDLERQWHSSPGMNQESGCFELLF
jgi:hypothetical protein